MDVMDETCTKNRSVALEIIILCARADLSPKQIDQLKELCHKKKEWDNFFDLAMQHRVLPLVYKNLRKYCAHSIPQKILDQGKQIYRNNGTRNLLMTGYLARVLSLLREHGIPAMAFKGPVLAVTLYGDSSLRSFGDIDVLIQRHHLMRAVKILANQGFLPSFQLNDRQLLKLSQTDNEFPLLHKANGISLDLQWEITGGYFSSQMTFEDLFEKHKTMRIGGEKISVFSDEYLLFYLCIHGNQHTWKQLDHVCCVAGLITKSPDLDWDAVFLMALKYKGMRMLLIGLLLAKDLFGTVPPRRFSIHLQEDSQAMKLAAKISYDLRSPEQTPESVVNHRFVKYHLLSMDYPLLGIRYALRLFFIPTRYDWQCYPLPASLSFLHYLIRPFRIAWEGIRAVYKQSLPFHK